MLCETKRDAEPTTFDNVLILVIVEYALWAVKLNPYDNMDRVLILVIVEYALWAHSRPGQLRQGTS